MRILPAALKHTCCAAQSTACVPFPSVGKSSASPACVGSSWRAAAFPGGTGQCPNKSATLCSAVGKHVDWESRAASGRLRIQKEQNRCLGDCLRIASLANLKYVHKKCLVLPCLQLRYRTQFKKMVVFAKLWLLYSHWSTYLFVCSRSKCSVQAAFLLQLILIFCPQSYKSRENKTLTDIYCFGWYMFACFWVVKVVIFIIFAAYQPGCSHPIRSVNFTGEIILTLEKLLLIWTIIQNAWWKSPSRNFPSRCLQDSCRSSEA